MIVKQIDMETALQLAAKGMEIKVLVPTDLDNRWESMEPDTLQNMLADVLFFRQEPALEKPMFEVGGVKADGDVSLIPHEVDKAVNTELEDDGNPPQP